MRKIVACCTIAVGVGCSNAPPPANTRTDVVAGDLVTSLEVEVRGDTVGLGLHLTNSGTQPAVLEFNTAARYDFAVQDATGAEVWRLSQDMMYAQVLGSETIEPGGTRRYTAKWLHGSRTGAFVATGRVLASNRSIEQRTQFEIPKR